MTTKPTPPKPEKPKRSRPVTIWDKCKAFQRESELLAMRRKRHVDALATVDAEIAALQKGADPEVLKMLGLDK